LRGLWSLQIQHPQFLSSQRAWSVKVRPAGAGQKPFLWQEKAFALHLSFFKSEVSQPDFR